MSRVGALLRAALGDRRVVRRGVIVDGGRKGVMAGTPIAPLLATLYFRDLDAEVGGSGATYARYSDDIAVLAPPAELPQTGTPGTGTAGRAPPRSQRGQVGGLCAR